MGVFSRCCCPGLGNPKLTQQRLSCYNPAQPDPALHLAERRALAPLSSSLRHLHPRISSDVKPSRLRWAPGLGARPRSSEAGAGVLLPTSGNPVTPKLGILGSYFEMAIFMLSQCLARGLTPFEVVHWTGLNLDNCTVGHCFLGFKIFHIIFKSFLNYASGLFGQSYQDSAIFFQLFLSLASKHQTAQRASWKWEVWRIPSHFLPIPHCSSPASKSARFSCCLQLLSPADELYPEGEVRHSRFLGRNESNGKGTKGSQMLNIDE